MGTGRGARNIVRGTGSDNQNDAAKLPRFLKSGGARSAGRGSGMVPAMSANASELPASGHAAVSERPPTRALPLRPTIALFVASGAAGLVDQVCFSKYLSYVVGATAYAVSA